MKASHSRPSRLVPEVVQTSAMDCGPACLKAILEGHGVRVSYGRLREACQTEVDGTSIDTLEQVAVQLGLDAEQVMVPADFLLIDEAKLLPALVVTRLPSGVTHFVVVWNQVGPWVQVMDPGSGRLWRTRATFLRDLFIHSLPVPVSDWLEWARSDGFLDPLRVLMAAVGVPAAEVTRLVESVLGDGGWRPLATLDAATRMVGSMVRSGGLRRGREASSVLVAAFGRQLASEQASTDGIPAGFWSVLASCDAREEQLLHLRGAVLVRFRGLKSRAEDGQPFCSSDLPEDLKAALDEEPVNPLYELFRHLRPDGLLPPAVLAGGAAVAALTVMVEALLFRGLLDVSRFLGFSEQRLGAAVAVVAFLLAVLVLAVPNTAALFRLGRHLEVRLRMAFLSKVPRLGDRYFHSRLNSDMAERAHVVHRMRTLPVVMGSLWRLICFMTATTGAIIWFDPLSAPAAVAAALVSVSLPLISQKFLIEKDLNVHTHVGALTRFFLDSLLGLTALRCHAAERAVRREHEMLLVEWSRASLKLLKAAVGIEGVVTLAGFVAAVWVLASHLGRSDETGTALLLVYWVLSLPALGQEIASTARMVPSLRNITLRLIEPLGAPDETTDDGTATGAAGELTEPVTISFQNVAVRAGGHTILDGIDFRIAAGSHIAVVGPSGAGKSTLVGLLLGWHRPAAGSITIDGRVLDGAALSSLRRHTTWIDPAVQIWNRPLIDNLYYGTEGEAPQPLAATLEQARLYDVVERLPDGLQTKLGESGGLLSGGEGQRVRLGRALNRSKVRLAILDEPFRGLDRGQRRALLEQTRQRFQDATLICVTHDIRETQTFDRVIVMDGGRVVEDGPTSKLTSNPDSRYRRLLDAEDELHVSLWMDPEWRRVTVRGGIVAEEQDGGSQ